MKIKIYKPLDEECHQMEEYQVDTNTGERKFTGKRFRKVGNYIPIGTDEFNAFVQEMRAKGQVILYSPADLKPYPYELILG
jgi:hypothetical protein